VANADQEDADGDGQGDACDMCPNDADNDIDDDEVCGDIDNCVNTPNQGQDNNDNDTLGNACDNCDFADNEDQVDTDGDGQGDVCDVCPNDADNDIDDDGICGDIDICPGTVLPESVPTHGLGTNRFANTDTDIEFETTAPSGEGPQKSFSMEDTQGCSCEQIIDILALGKGHTKFGCSISAMEDFISSLE